MKFPSWALELVKMGWRWKYHCLLQDRRKFRASNPTERGKERRVLEFGLRVVLGSIQSKGRHHKCQAVSLRGMMWSSGFGVQVFGFLASLNLNVPICKMGIIFMLPQKITVWELKRIVL